MTKIVRNIGRIPLMLNGKKLQPGKEAKTELTEGVQRRIVQGFLEVVRTVEKAKPKAKPVETSKKEEKEDIGDKE